MNILNNDVQTFSYSINSYDDFDKLVNFIMDVALEDGITPAIGFAMHIIVDEIASNTTQYGFVDASKKYTLTTTVKLYKDKIIMIFTDDGVQFNPLEQEPYDVSSNVENSINEMSVGGLGLHIVRSYADDIQYEYKDGCNILTVTKYHNVGAIASQRLA
jgi:anti-sigma regulatory factor (Ser/Thr protein kinase)